MTVIDLSDPVRGASTPDRFWTTTNIAEATPELLSPLCWDVWSGFDQAWLNAMYDFGLLSRSEKVSDPDPNKKAMGVIYGRQAANVEVIRKVMGRLPGVSPDDVERSLLGSVRTGLPSEEGAGLRMLVIAVKLPWVMMRTKSLVLRMHDRNRRWWMSEVSAPTTPADSLYRLEVARDNFITAAEMHSRIRFLMPMAERAVAAAAEKANIEDVSALTGGLGGVAETALADDLWRVSRGQLSLEDFLREHGFHGPNEGNVFTKSWREQPQRVQALVETYRKRTDVARPRDLERIAREKRQVAIKQALQGAPRSVRFAMQFSLTRLGNLTRSLELTKASYLRALDAARAAARAIGDDFVDRGILNCVEDTFFLNVEEIRQVARGTLQSDVAQKIVDYRRAQRVRYAECRLPISFTGMPELEAREDLSFNQAVRVQLSGAAGGCGVAEGRARVVLDPNEDVELEPGDILVCRFTDPSWAPLFVCAAALVIDIGTSVSHGAVVARELGIPYVIGTGDGTRVIRDYDQIRVDGPARLVSVVAHHSAAEFSE